MQILSTVAAQSHLPIFSSLLFREREKKNLKCNFKYHSVQKSSFFRAQCCLFKETRIFSIKTFSKEKFEERASTVADVREEQKSWEARAKKTDVLWVKSYLD